MLIFMKETKGLSDDQVKRLYRPAGMSGAAKYSPTGRDDYNY